MGRLGNLPVPSLYVKEHTALPKVPTNFIYVMILSMKNIIPSPKGILFDMDGVLLITTQSSDQSWHLVCQHFASLLSLSSQCLEDALRESSQTYRRAIEHDAQKQRRDRLEPFETRCETIEQALEQVGRRDSTIAPEMVRMYEALRDDHRQLAPHALEILQKLRDQDLPLALISNGNAMYQRQKIKQYHLVPFFDAILIEEEFGVAKPDQKIFLEALNQLHITAQETWMIGDDLAFDIAASQQLGIFAIWCDYAEHKQPQALSIHPDRIIHTLPELFDLFRDTSTSAILR
jgi:putative hydrolase of the HAD superfamily